MGQAVAVKFTQGYPFQRLYLCRGQVYSHIHGLFY